MMTRYQTRGVGSAQQLVKILSPRPKSAVVPLRFPPLEAEPIVQNSSPRGYRARRSNRQTPLGLPCVYAVVRHMDLSVCSRWRFDLMALKDLPQTPRATFATMGAAKQRTFQSRLGLSQALSGAKPR